VPRGERRICYTREDSQWKKPAQPVLAQGKASTEQHGSAENLTIKMTQFKLRKFINNLLAKVVEKP